MIRATPTRQTAAIKKPATRMSTPPLARAMMPPDRAQRCLEILGDPELGKRLGRAGKEHARERFLSPRLLRDWLELFTKLDA